MRNLTLMMLGVLACAPAIHAMGNVPVEAFNLTKAAGLWYVRGFASNAAWFMVTKTYLKMGRGLLTPTPENHMHFHFANKRADKTCWRLIFPGTKTETPGRFAYWSDPKYATDPVNASLWTNHNDMSFTEIDYDKYAILHTIKNDNGSIDVLNKLLTREYNSSTALHERFIQFSLQTGILRENILILADNEICPIPEPVSDE